MPELPEVEVVTNALRPHLLGRRIVGVERFSDKLRYPLDIDRRSEIRDQEIAAVRRRGRWTLVETANRFIVLLHLGMTGSCRVVPSGEPRRKHEHVVWHLDNDWDWRFIDPRKFGIIEVHPIPEPGGEPACLAHLGPEPLTDAFDGDLLFAATRGRRGPIKPLLMDNRLVVGIGNIYASEALFRAGIRPTTPSGRIAKGRYARLARAIKNVLADAIAAGGTTIIDFAGLSGDEGRFTRELAVYGRAGEPCRRCEQGTIRHLRLSGRSTYYCPRCQH